MALGESRNKWPHKSWIEPEGLQCSSKVMDAFKSPDVLELSFCAESCAETMSLSLFVRVSTFQTATAGVNRCLGKQSIAFGILTFSSGLLPTRPKSQVSGTGVVCSLVIGSHCIFGWRCHRPGNRGTVQNIYQWLLKLVLHAFYVDIAFLCV